MEAFRPIIVALAISVLFLSAFGFSQPDSKIVKVVEKNRTTDLMAGSVFEVQFRSGGTEKFSYVRHKEEYCIEHPEASGCPPEEVPEKPPFMQNFSFSTNSTEPIVYRPEESICLEDGAYIKCKGLARFEVMASNFLQ